MADTQGSSQGLGAALLIDADGDDLYQAAERSQGASCCGDPAPAEPGPGEGAAAVAWRQLDNGTEAVRVQAGGLGVLADFNGTDRYEGGARSQGYADNLAVTAAQNELATGDHGTRGFAGILFDATGNDTYRYATQGFAEVEALTSSFSDYGRPVGLLADAAGNDTYLQFNVYDAALLPADDGDHDGMLLGQGYARGPSATSVPSARLPTAVGAFLELGGTDTYRTITLASTVAPAGFKNNFQRPPATRTPDPQATVAVPLFVDLEPTQLQEAVVDSDGDGAPLVVELLAGTDPGKGTDSPGGLFGPDPGPDHDYLVRAPRILGKAPLAGDAVRLPGLAIGGYNGTAYGEAFDFMVDLGGDDTYTAPTHGGAVLPSAADPSHRPPVVAFALDAAGNDTYAPSGQVEQHLTDISIGTYAYGALPSLGGADLGVAVLADLGGRNTFDSTLSVASFHDPEDRTAGASLAAFAAGWGVSQGAGLLGGVGLLMTNSSSNDFRARVTVSADDLDAKPQASASAMAASQGAGLLGVGLMANLRSGNDTYALSANASAAGGILLQRADALDAGQGAGYAGVGLLLDDGGRNAYSAPEGVAQGTGWGLQQRTGTMQGLGFPTQTASLDDQADPVGGFGYHIDPGVGVGLLLGGAGDDSYEAAGPAQGAGGSFQALTQASDTKFDPTHPPIFHLTGGAGLGALVDRAGADRYGLPAPGARLRDATDPTPALVGQGAALADSAGLLVDLQGDDEYRSGPGVWSQGASVGGIAILADLEGQDLYTAADQAQGYAQAALLAAVRDHVCYAEGVPCTAPPQAFTFARGRFIGNQLLLDALPQGTTVGTLVDAEGLDHYQAGQESQGYAVDQADAPLLFAFCRDPYDVGGNGTGAQIGHREIAGCDGRAPGGGSYPIDDPGVLPGTPGHDFMAQKPLGPNERGPLVGVLLDGDGTDQYDYADDSDGDSILKVAADGERPADLNDWRWTQESIAQRDLSDTGLPDNPVKGDPGVPGGAWPTVDGAYPRSLPAAALPAPPHYGGGLDASTMAAALSALAAGPAPPLTVRLVPTRDEAGDDPLDGGTASDGVFAQVRVESPTGPAIGVSGVDIVTERGLLGEADPVDGDPGAYRLHWVFHPAGEDPSESMPDGPHRLQAVARVAPVEGGPGRGVASEAATVRVDAPPVVGVRLLGADGSAVSEVSGRTAPPTPDVVAVTVDLGADERFPPGVAASGSPGGYLTVQLAGAAGTFTLQPKTYVGAGTHTVPFSGRCSPACPDGAYNVRVLVEDAGGQRTETTAPLRVDSAAPHSRVLLPRYAGATPELQSGFDGLHVPWSVDDAGGPAGLLTDVMLVEGSGDSIHAVPVADWTGLLASHGPLDHRPIEGTPTLRFIGVAHDRLGNSESPCDPGEAAPCSKAFLRAWYDAATDTVRDPARIVTTTVDFVPPQVTNVAADTDFLQPGRLLTIGADVHEEGVGLLAVLAEVAQGDHLETHELSRVGSTEHFVAQWDAEVSGFDANETDLSVKVIALDLAGNDDSDSARLVLDGQAPRLEAAPTRYYASGDLDESGRLDVGRPGAFAVFRVRIADRALGSDIPGSAVRLDPAPLNATYPALPLRFDPATEAWASSPLPIPADAANGLYELPVDATDAAGNVAHGAVTLVLDRDPPQVGELQALEATHDSVTVAWTSENATRDRVRYGRTGADLARETPLGDESALVHAVQVSGLSPNTQYYFQGVSQGGNGVLNHTQTLGVRTASAIRLGLDGIVGDSVRGGLAPVRVQVALLTGEEAPVQVSLSAQSDNASLRPVPLADLPASVGDRGATLDLRILTDGVWRIRLDAFRPGDHATLFSAPFRVDNGAPFLIPLAPAPGTVVAQAKPGIQVAVGDPDGDPSADWAAGARLLVDGKPVPARAQRAEGLAAPGGTSQILLVPEGDLADGPHLLRVEAADLAGNRANVTWPATIDTAAPLLAAVNVTGPEGLPWAPPGGTVRIAAELRDTTPLASASLDLAPVGGPRVPLVREGKLWTADVPLPASATGSPAFTIAAADRAGNLASYPGAATVGIDGAAPVATAEAARATTTMLRIQVHADEPVRAAATADGNASDAATAERVFASDPVLDLAGLVPGTAYAVHVVLTDRAGQSSALDLDATTAPDLEPPAAPRLAPATSPEEGVVELAWAEAADDSGVARYEAALGDGAWAPVGNGSARSASLPAAPGASLPVHLRAVDLAGNPGPAAESRVDVLALPHLGPPEADGEGRAGHPVRFQVLYWHGAGTEGNLTLLVGDQAVPMKRASGDCRTGCLYTAKAVLPATDLFAAPTYRIEASDGRHATATPDTAVPPVVASSASAPAAGLGVAFLLVLLAWTRRRRPA
jgi:hypothetical protein